MGGKLRLRPKVGSSSAARPGILQAAVTCGLQVCPGPRVAGSEHVVLLNW